MKWREYMALVLAGCMLLIVSCREEQMLSL